MYLVYKIWQRSIPYLSDIIYLYVNPYIPKLLYVRMYSVIASAGGQTREIITEFILWRRLGSALTPCRCLSHAGVLTRDVQQPLCEGGGASCLYIHEPDDIDFLVIGYYYWSGQRYEMEIASQVRCYCPIRRWRRPGNWWGWVMWSKNMEIALG